MKTIWGLSMIIGFAFLLYGSLFVVLGDIESNNTSLGADSLDYIDTFNIAYQGNLSKIEDLSTLDTNISSNETNQIDAFVREYAESKKNTGKVVPFLVFLYNIPTFVVLSIPIIDVVADDLKIFNFIIVFMLSVLLTMVIYKAIRTGRVDDE